MTNLKAISTSILLTALILTGCNQNSEEANGNSELNSADVNRDTSDVVTNDTNGTVELKTESTDQLGKYLTDNKGRSLYMFLADSSEISRCYDACAEAWPPLITEGQPQAGEGVQSSLISTFERKNGQLQVAYNGWPLYYYVKDGGAGKRTGQDIKDFGVEWYLVTPEGKKLHSEGHHE